MGYFVWKPEQFEFQGYRGARHKAAIEFVEKHILVSRFGALSDVRALGKVLIAKISVTSPIAINMPTRESLAR